jgi:hypothetical protein
LKTLFGPPPVLSSESEGLYYELLLRWMRCLSPRDFAEQILIKDIADETWNIMRFRRHKNLTIESTHQAKLQAEARNREMQAQWRKQFQDIAAGKKGESGPDVASEAVEVIETTTKELDELLKKVPEEIEHAAAMKADIAYYDKLNKLEGESFKRREDLFQQLENYRANLGLEARRMSDELIDGEYNVVDHGDDAPLAPVDQAT